MLGTKCVATLRNIQPTFIMSKAIILLGGALVALIAATVGSLWAKGRTTTLNTSTIDTLDIPRYMGTWYEIARFDHSFERDMSLVTANYKLQPDGTVEVINSGFNTRRGRYKQSRGRARVVADRTGELEVTFFLNFWSPYKILELAPDYSYALVGSDSDKYLWILSRTPRLPSATLSDIVAMAEERGYNTDLLIWVEQQ